MQCALNYSRKVNDAKAKQMRVTWQWLCDEENCAMVVRRVFEGDDRSYGNWKLSSCWIMQSSWSLSEHASIMALSGSLFGLQARALVQKYDMRWKMRRLSAVCHWFVLFFTLQHMKTSRKVAWEDFLWNHRTICVWYVLIDRCVRGSFWSGTQQ